MNSAQLEQSLQWFGANNNLFLEGFANTLTSGLTWLPLYIMLGFLVIRNNKTMSQVLLCFVCGLLGVAISSGIGYFGISIQTANAFSLSVFFILLTRSLLLSSSLITWAFVITACIIYNNPTEIEGIGYGLLCGLLIGFITYLLYYKVYNKITPKGRFISTQYTSTGYAVTDIDICVTIIMLVLVYSILKSTIV